MEESYPIAPQVDTWPWGRELIYWGFKTDHQYTLKGLQPKKGRDGCLSLQYHKLKSETWVCMKGVAWALVVVDGKVCTRLLKEGSVQNLPQGTIHRLMGTTDDVLILEPSTPDIHAANKAAPKDVFRLACVHGRECSPPRDEQEKLIIERCIEVTDQAISQVESGLMPEEINAELLISYGGFALPGL